MIKLQSPAKINLFLEVTGKRPDGYHNIDSIFVTINLYDEITIKLTDNNLINITTNNPTVPNGESNIIYKAVQAVNDVFALNIGANIDVEKNIPVGAGLGGGSSNAGSVIRALCQHLNLNINDDNLYKKAAKIGADVPYFLKGGGLCRCTGIGDIIEKIQHSGDLNMWFVLVNPGIFVSTAGIYKQTLLTNTQNNSIMLLRAVCENDKANLSNCFYNKLEDVAIKLYPEIEHVKESLSDSGCVGVCMSGSGSSVFGLVLSEKDGYEVIEKLRAVNKNWFVRLVKAVA